MKFSQFLEMVDSSSWYHGSENLFNQFTFKNYKHSQQLGFGIHFCNDLEFAKLYGKYIYSVDLFPVKTLDTTKIYSVEDPEYQFALSLYKRQRRFQLFVDSGKFAINLDVVRPNKAVEVLRDYGYDSVLYDAKYGSIASNMNGMHITAKALSMVMLNPEQIKIMSVLNKADL